MANEHLKTEAKKAGVRLWEVGEALGMDDSAFSRKLRHEFTADQMERALTIIREIADTRKNEGC